MDIPAARPLRAALFMLLASALIAGTSLMAKALGNGLTGDPLHPLQVSAGRFVFAFTALLIASPILKPRFQGARWPAHFLRSLFGWLGVTCMFAAAARMPLAEATAISFLSPIATMILAIPLLGEKVGPVRWSAAAIAMIGAMILMRPGTEAFQVAALIALLGAFLMGLEVIYIKRLTGSEPTTRILFINNAIGATMAATAASFVWIQPSTQQWAVLIALGLVMVSAQTCFIQAMKSADASYAMPFFYTTLIFAALYDFGLFDVIPAAISFVGAAVIICGALLLMFRERRKKGETSTVP